MNKGKKSRYLRSKTWYRMKKERTETYGKKSNYVTASVTPMHSFCTPMLPTFYHISLKNMPFSS